MSVSDNRKVDFVWKKIKGRIFTDNFPSSSGKEFYEEFPGTLVNPHSSEIWVDDIPIPAPGTSTSVVSYFNDLILTEDNSVTGHRSWLACGTVGDPSTRIKGWVPPRFHQSYTVRIYDDNGQEITTTSNVEWFFDYENGVLVFENDPTTLGISLPIHLRGYRYIGSSLSGITSRSSNKYLFKFNEDDYATGKGNSHILWIKQDVFRDPNLFKVYIDGVEHTFSFYTQRRYKHSDGIDPGTYYTQHIDIDDYPVGSESSRNISIEYEEEIRDQNNYNLVLTRDDNLNLNNKTLPLTFSMWDSAASKFYYYYLHNATIDRSQYLVNATYRCTELAGTSVEYKNYTRAYAARAYVKEFPLNYDFLTNNNMLLELWQVNTRRSRNINLFNNDPDNMFLVLKTMYRYNNISFNDLRTGVYLLRFINLSDNTFSNFFKSKLKITRMKVFYTDATLSVKYYVGVLTRGLVS